MKVLSENDLKEITFGGLLKILSVKRIYKYISFENGLQYLLKDNSLKFSSPNLFNDPYDCNPLLFELDISKTELYDFIDKLSYDRATRRLLKKKANSKLMIDSLYHKRNKTKIYCFSETNKDNLMWSHYGDYHRGLCIGFEFPIKYKNDFVLYPVNYPNTFEKVKFNKDTNRVLYYWLTTKASEWQYEKEIRAICINNNEYCSFEKERITEIVLGYKTTQEQKEKLYRTLRQKEYSTNIEIKQIDINKTSLELILKSLTIK